MRIASLLCLLVACRDDPPRVATGGEASLGRARIVEYGCAACHDFPEIRARGGGGGLVAPPLTGFARRTFIAGRLPNSPENLVLWLRDPHAIDPQTAMPELGLTEKEARDVAAYLYTLD